MPRLHAVLALLSALALASCAGSRSASSSSREAQASPTTTSASSTIESDQGSTEPEQGTTEPDQGTTAASTPAPDRGPPPVLGLRGTPERGARGVAIVVENRGTELARVAPALALERAGADGGFEPVRSVRLSLRPACGEEPPSCVELAPGAALHPPAWLGTEGDAQCACERCVPAEPGTYRFVATSCGGSHRAEGEPFELAR